MKKILLFSMLLFKVITSEAQCSPSDSVIAHGDPENDGVLSPFFLEVYPGEEINATITVLAPPDGEGEIGGFLNVPYTMNYFIVKRLNNMPDWISYECPDNCQFNVNEYSCVQVTGTAPLDVPVGDSTVMDVIVDANVDATVGFINFNDYEVEDENGGTLTIRYKEAPSSLKENFNPTVYYNLENESIEILHTTNFTCTVYSIFGSTKLVSKNNTINLSEFDKGIYFIEVISDTNSRYIQKIIKP